MKAKRGFSRWRDRVAQLLVRDPVRRFMICLLRLGLAECERKSLYTGIQKLDLEKVVSYGLWPMDELNMRC